MASTINASTSGGLVTTADTSGVLQLQTANTTAVTIDASQNVGVGVTPSAWASGIKALQLGSYSSLYDQTGATVVGNNFYNIVSGSRYLNTAAATAFVQESGKHIWYNAPSGTAGNTASFTQAMTLDGSGNLGVGTSSPSYSFHVVRSSGSALGVFERTSGGLAYIEGTASTGVVGTGSNHPLLFTTNSGERARIDTSGNLFVGSTSLPTTTGFGVSQYSGGTYTRIAHNTSASSTDGYVQFFYNNTQIGQIQQNGTSAVSYSTSSDYRLKENVQPMTGALAKVAALKPCTYKWKADGSDGEGFIAHELAEVVPQCVTGEKDAVDADGNPVYQGIDTSFLVATLAAAIQELKAELDQAKAEIATLKGA